MNTKGIVIENVLASLAILIVVFVLLVVTGCADNVSFYRKPYCFQDNNGDIQCVEDTDQTP